MALRSAAGLKSSSGMEPPRQTFKDALVAQKASSSQKTTTAQKPVMTQMSPMGGSQTSKPDTITRPRNESINEPNTASNTSIAPSSQAADLKTGDSKFDAVHGDNRGQQMVANAGTARPEANDDAWASPDATASSNAGGPPDSGGKAGVMSPGADPNRASQSRIPGNDAEARANYANNVSNGPVGRRIAGKTFDFANRHRKSLIFGGGGMGIVLALIFATLAFLPLKLESFMNNVISNEGKRMEHYATRRAEIMTYRYLMNAANGTIESDPLYTSSNIVRMMWGNFQKDRFIEKLQTSKGITVERGGSAGSIRFTTASGQVVEASNLSQLMDVLKSNPAGTGIEAEIGKFMENEYKWFRIFQRRSIRYYLAKAYGIKRWSIDKKEDKVDPKSKVHSTEIQARELALDGPNEKTINAIGCVAAPENCNGEDSNRRSTDPNGESTIDPPNTTGGNEEESKAQAEAKKGLLERYRNLKTTAGNKILATLTELIGSEVIAKGILKAVPFIGWISFAADIDHFIWGGSWSQVGINLRALQYVSVAQTWATLKDQMKADELTASQINVLMLMLDGIEKSNAFQRTNSANTNGGVTIPEEKRVGSDGAFIDPEPAGQGICGITYPLSNEYRGIPVNGLSITNYEPWTLLYRRVVTTPLLIGAGNVHFDLCTFRAVFQRFMGVIMLGVKNIPGVGQFISTFQTLTQFVMQTEIIQRLVEQGSHYVTAFLERVFGLVYNGEWGAPLANTIDGGWEVITNAVTRDHMGGKAISYSLSYEQTTQYALEDQQKLNAEGPFASLLAWNTPGSTGSKLLAALPSTPSALANRFTDLASSLFLHPASYFSKLAYNFSTGSLAVDPASLRSPAGVMHIGFDAAEVNDSNIYIAVKDINGPPVNGAYPGQPDGRIDEYDCIEGSGSGESLHIVGTTDRADDITKTNRCLYDTSVALPLCSGGSSNDDGGLGQGGDPGPCGRVAGTSATGQAGSPLTANWMSGASFMQGDYNGTPKTTGFGTWRNSSPVTIVGTWCDKPGCTDGSAANDYDSFNGAMDIAIGGIFKQNGESWSAAAGGAYNSRWQGAISNIASHRQGKGLTFIRFAHEANMNFSDWSVMPGEEANYITTFCNVANMAHAAGLKVTWSLNDGTLGGAAGPATMYPGDACVDVVGPDTYDWDTPQVSVVNGQVTGIESWRQFALSHNKPLAFPEWGANNTQGQTKDNPAYITAMNTFMATNGGSGPGQFIYDIYFNEDESGYRIGLWPTADVPQMANTYKALKWGN